MYFVVIDIDQLYTRLRNSAANRSVDMKDWLDRHGFVRTVDGWYGSADAMNTLSCSEIVFSEWCHPYHRSPQRSEPAYARFAVS